MKFFIKLICSPHLSNFCTYNQTMENSNRNFYLSICNLDGENEFLGISTEPESENEIIVNWCKKIPIKHMLLPNPQNIKQIYSKLFLLIVEKADRVDVDQVGNVLIHFEKRVVFYNCNNLKEFVMLRQIGGVRVFKCLLDDILTESITCGCQEDI
jgi:hypothetical protein